MGFGKKLKKWHKGLGNTLKFWDPKAVKKGIRQQWSLDPLGKKLNKLSSMFRKNSAASYGSYGSYGYGHTGSIVGRY